MAPYINIDADRIRSNYQYRGPSVLRLRFAKFHEDVFESLRGNTAYKDVAFERNKNLTDVDLSFLSTLPNLKQLYINDYQITGEFLKYISNSQLTYFKFNARELSKESQRYFRGLKELRTLSISAGGVDASFFSQLPSDNKIQTLSLSRSVFQRGNSDFLRLKHHEILKMLNAPGSSHFIPYLKYCPKLKALFLNNCDLCDVDLSPLKNKDLMGLHLTLNPRITDAAMKHISQFSQLMVLSLSGSSITMEGIKTLASGPAAASLVELTLDGCDGFFPDVDVISHKNFPQLESISLSYSDRAKEELLGRDFTGSLNEVYEYEGSERITFPWYILSREREIQQEFDKIREDSWTFEEDLDWD